MTDTFNFTKGYKELEAIVEDFESRELDLEKDIAKFEKGLQLAKKLQKRLETLENKISEITVSYTEDKES